MPSIEVNFDGLIGPTHHYGGLASGNLASHRNALSISSPKQAALQGLEKMRTLINLGYVQGFIPPQMRPDLTVLRQLGFNGSDQEVLQRTITETPQLLSMVYSASSMWAANAATVTPSTDSLDGRVHFTPANLLTSAHRSIEHTQTQRALNAIFADVNYFAVHPALPPINRFADEGAANHTRLCTSYDDEGVGLFVYGRDANTNLTALTFPARQTREASAAIARQHGVRRAVYLQQSSVAINAGAFHNDVVAVGNGPVLFFHEDAYEHASLKQALHELTQELPLKTICVSASQVSLENAISSYLFNSQLLASPQGDMDNMCLIAPTECEDNPQVRAYLAALVEDKSQPIRHVHFINVRESMSNGGGPACLRLRVALTPEELAAVNPAFLLDNHGVDVLQDWVNRHYREHLAPADLADPALYEESHKALTELSELLKAELY
ncbi:MAG: N-succinylarginine dihydrolase [Oleibacter sp.]|nr:N-succinylarginine dihydrolase [Thalassolituus sp.]